MWPEVNPGAVAWSCALALAIVSTALAYVIFFGILARAGALAASTVTFLVPVFALVWGAALLGEALSWREFLGMAVTLLGTTLTTGLVRADLFAARDGMQHAQTATEACRFLEPTQSSPAEASPPLLEQRLAAMMGRTQGAR